MVLKRQTVWLMTMISLILVLGMYYLMSDPSERMAVSDDSEENESFSEQDWEAWLEEAEEVTVTVEEEKPVQEPSEDERITASEVFSALRLERQEARSRMSEEYRQTIADANVPASIKSDAHSKKEALDRLAQQEAQLETLIQAEGYDDVIVLADENEVRIIVQADHLDKEEVVAINRLAAEHFGERNFAVGFHPAP